MATRVCPVYRSDVVYESMCIVCQANDSPTTSCKVLTGKMVAHKDNDGKFVVDKEVK